MCQTLHVLFGGLQVDHLTHWHVGCKVSIFVNLCASQDGVLHYAIELLTVVGSLLVLYEELALFNSPLCFRVPDHKVSIHAHLYAAFAVAQADQLSCITHTHTHTHRYTHMSATNSVKLSALFGHFVCVTCGSAHPLCKLRYSKASLSGLRPDNSQAEL